MPALEPDNGARVLTTVTGRDGADEMLEQASGSAGVEGMRVALLGSVARSRALGTLQTGMNILNTTVQEEESTKVFPSGSRNLAKAPQGCDVGGSMNSTPRALSWR
jgi:hypothetical protein